MYTFKFVVQVLKVHLYDKDGLFTHLISTVHGLDGDV